MRADQERPTRRPTARALILDARDRLLLFLVLDPAATDPEFWITPGGGVEPGESFAQALVREVWEETGLAEVATRPWVWSRRHLFCWGGATVDSDERFYLVRVEALEVTTDNMIGVERDTMREHRWWSASEILSAASHVFVPRRLGNLIVPLIEGRITERPIDVGA